MIQSISQLKEMIFSETNAKFEEAFFLGIRWYPIYNGESNGKENGNWDYIGVICVVFSKSYMPLSCDPEVRVDQNARA